MNLPEGNNLLWALIHDMDGEENLDIYRLVSMSEEEIEGLEYMPDGAHANASRRSCRPCTSELGRVNPTTSIRTQLSGGTRI